MPCDNALLEAIGIGHKGLLSRHLQNLCIIPFTGALIIALNLGPWFPEHLLNLITGKFYNLAPAVKFKGILTAPGRYDHTWIPVTRPIPQRPGPCTEISRAIPTLLLSRNGGCFFG